MSKEGLQIRQYQGSSNQKTKNEPIVGRRIYTIGTAPVKELS